MTQTNLLDELEKKKDQAIIRAEIGASYKWFDEAYDAGLVLARTGRPFTSEYIWRMMKHTGLTTADNRAMGPVMLKLARDGYIKSTGKFTKSMRPERHRAPIAEWVGI